MKNEGKVKKAESFLQLEKELDIYRKLMSQAADVIRVKDVSDYPICVAHQQEMEIGMLIHDSKKQGGKWNIHASTLEEFVTRQIVFDDKVDEFKSNYKDGDSYVCVFILSELGAQFVFLPRK